MHAVVVMAAIYKIEGSSMSADAENVVLIVEDEPLILMLLADYLAGEGYRVLQAENGEQAFEILATKPHLDLMITDYRLPGGVSGVQIAEPAVMLRPELKVIFISGYPAEILDSGSPIALKAPILAKPFTMETLQSQIQALLA
ncbi:Response regulator [Pseudomonas coronafaciens pv. oryzae]|uniref:Response regulator n=4 Tax=Pseudomonas syringae group TaxID=136849 RepID=A0AB37QVM1_9PSED|nr:Response regulator [Pseudomonas coronafaciens pv. oryzae]KPY19103.1 Response regulator [Pseudomonas coronafaciens pv. porri]KPZ25319.1 Response regulator [Pseudomonas coronafaciens pv. zizaniae]RMP31347.1 Response regulator [Pseudomonas coronafaciens pv. atropurpurea]RMS06002.1 Response regulator [Pseudomonas coronafaciens pv. garcae]RMS12926.1 Response regulator [Pseudomonas coronafaciens pv. coronafaciens]